MFPPRKKQFGRLGNLTFPRVNFAVKGSITPRKNPTRYIASEKAKREKTGRVFSLARQTGWLAGARDSEVGKTLALMHRNPAHPWTIASLAREAGVSRSVLAERFRHYLNEPPMAYLTRWRLQLGAQMLASTSYSVAQIASEVGYESEAAFNRAFKRAFETPPARFRGQSRSTHTTSPARKCRSHD